MWAVDTERRVANTRRAGVRRAHLRAPIFPRPSSRAHLPAPVDAGARTEVDTTLSLFQPHPVRPRHGHATAVLAGRCSAHATKPKLGFPHFTRSGSQALRMVVPGRHGLRRCRSVAGTSKNPPLSMRGLAARGDDSALTVGHVHVRAPADRCRRKLVTHVVLTVRRANVPKIIAEKMRRAAESRGGRVPPPQPGRHTASAALSGPPHLLRDEIWRIVEQARATAMTWHPCRVPLPWHPCRVPLPCRIAESRAQGLRANKCVNRDAAKFRVMAGPRVGVKARPRTGSGRPATTLLCGTKERRGWPAGACPRAGLQSDPWAGHQTAEYDAATVDLVVSPRVLTIGLAAAAKETTFLRCRGDRVRDLPSHLSEGPSVQPSDHCSG